MNNFISASNIWEILDARALALSCGLPQLRVTCATNTATLIQSYFCGGQNSQLLYGAVGPSECRKGSLVLIKAEPIPGCAMEEEEEAGSPSASPTL